MLLMTVVFPDHLITIPIKIIVLPDQVFAHLYNYHFSYLHSHLPPSFLRRFQWMFHCCLNYHLSQIRSQLVSVSVSSSSQLPSLRLDLSQYFIFHLSITLRSVLRWLKQKCFLIFSITVPLSLASCVAGPEISRAWWPIVLSYDETRFLWIINALFLNYVLFD